MKNNFGSYLSELRKSKKISMIELSKKSKISQSYISQLENGKLATETVINKLSKALSNSKNEQKEIKNNLTLKKEQDSFFRLLNNLETTINNLNKNDIDITEISTELEMTGSPLKNFLGFSTVEITEDAQKLLVYFDKLSEEDKQTVLSFAKFKYLESL